jgi:hypothetical protein
MRNGYKTKRRVKIKINRQDFVPENFVCAIYFLINKKTNVIEYIGQSSNVYQRLLTNYYYKEKKHIVRIMSIKHELLRWYERRWQQKYRPILNEFIPKINTNYMHNPYNNA